MKLFVKPVLIVMALCICYCANAQISDSLYAGLPAAIKPVNHHSLSEKEQRMLLDSAYLLHGKFVKELNALAQQVLLQAEKSSFIKNRILNTLSFAGFYKETDREKAIHYYKKVVEYCADKDEYNHFLQEAFRNISIVYCGNDMYDSSITYCYKGVEIGRKLNDPLSMFNCYKLICDIYLILGYYEKALHFNDIAMEIAAKNNLTDEYTERRVFKIRCYKNLAKEKHSAAYADSVIGLAKSIFVDTRMDSASWYGSVYLVLGQLNYDRKKYTQALAYYDSSLMNEYIRAPKYFKDPWAKKFHRALCLVWFGNYEAVNKMLDSLPANSYNNRQMIYQALYAREAAIKNWKAAFKYYQEYIHNKDMMKVVESGSLLAEAQQKNAITEKQMQITALENSNLIKEKAQSKLVTGAVITGMVLLLVIVILTALYRNAQTKRYSERQLLTAELYRMEAAMHDERQLQLDNIAAQRKKIAEDMHDEVSSGLAAFRFYIIDLKSKAVQTETIKILDELEQEAHVLYQQARNFMKNLNASKPAAGYNVYDLAEQLSSKFSNERSLVIRNNIDRTGVEQYFTGPMHYELYLVIKETVANSIKHAGASLVDIGIYFKNHTCFFSINDNGKGFNAATVSNGLGLNSITNRIKSINGNIKVYSNNSGTVVEGFFPV